MPSLGILAARSVLPIVFMLFFGKKFQGGMKLQSESGCHVAESYAPYLRREFGGLTRFYPLLHHAIPHCGTGYRNFRLGDCMLICFVA